MPERINDLSARERIGQVFELAATGALFVAGAAEFAAQAVGIVNDLRKAVRQDRSDLEVPKSELGMPIVNADGSNLDEVKRQIARGNIRLLPEPEPEPSKAFVAGENTIQPSDKHGHAHLHLHLVQPHGKKNKERKY